VYTAYIVITVDWIPSGVWSDNQLYRGRIIIVHRDYFLEQTEGSDGVPCNL